MKRLIPLFLAALTLTFTAAARLQAKQKAPQKVYMFGFAASFNDTIVHFTDVMEMDSAVVSPKTAFLQGRDQYSGQLREYLSTHSQLPRRTCITVFSTKRSKLEKKYVKMKRQYTQGKNQFDVRIIPASDFRFQPATLDEEEAAPKQPKHKQPKPDRPKGPGKSGPGKGGRPPMDRPAQ